MAAALDLAAAVAASKMIPQDDQRLSAAAVAAAAVAADLAAGRVEEAVGDLAASARRIEVCLHQRARASRARA